MGAKKRKTPLEVQGAYVPRGYSSPSFLRSFFSCHSATKPMIIRGTTTISTPKSTTSIPFAQPPFVLDIQRSPTAQVKTAAMNPLVIIITCGSSPCNMPPRNIAPKISLPKSTSNFPRFSLKPARPFNFCASFSIPVRYRWPVRKTREMQPAPHRLRTGRCNGDRHEILNHLRSMTGTLNGRKKTVSNG